MSRPKSAATIQRERDRAARREERERKRAERERDRKIREERRERKQAEREAKRDERLQKRAVRESIERNGVPKIRPEESHFGLREAMGFSPLVDCERCHAIVRELYGTLCERCHYSMEVNGEKKDELKAEENRAVPGKGDGRVNGTEGFAGQLLLLI